MYKLYNVYMEKEYSVKEFRDNMRIALDEAQSGKDVYIKRHDKRFFVCPESYYLELLKAPDQETLHAIPEATIENVLARAQPDFSVCKHGSHPKFCKHAKPGKPCK